MSTTREYKLCSQQAKNKHNNTLAFEVGPPQVDGGIGPLRLVGPWIGYRVFEEKNKKYVSFREQNVCHPHKNQ